MDERRAIERLKDGDIGGLEVLVRKHQIRAVRAAYLIVRDRGLAEDVVQGAFVRAYERIGGFDEKRPFGPWFIKVVVNDAIKAASRRERAAPSEHEGEDPILQLSDPSTRPVELAEEAETRRRVWAALEKLPPAQRAVVVQRYYLGMSEAEMSRDVPPGTIKWRLHAARKALSRMLRPWFRAEAAPTGASAHAPEGGKDRE
jgi:RNA polymerase sigma-70 factor, ECF subfamily